MAGCWLLLLLLVLLSDGLDERMSYASTPASTKCVFMYSRMRVAAMIFSAVYKLVSPFLAADTKAKVCVCSKNEDTVKALSKFIDPSQIPEFLGGQSKCDIPNGTSVPEVSAVPSTPNAIQ